ncbi:hypothetical protein RB2150_01774 [Rhodobacteraceae bacterium HTCC2150]|nr:hypothetical protein RB2150_01774 [Rhodobacteraceae bacterium HTCC2150]
MDKLNTGFQFETPRLDVQPWDQTLSDNALRARLVDQLATILTPPVLHHLPKPLQLAQPPHAIENWINERAAESAVLTIYDKANHSLLGLMILASFPQDNATTTVHLGYLLGETTWGKGFASELIMGLITEYKNQATPLRLLGGVETSNPASARVLVKNGFSRVETISTAETEFYELIL